jgi:hypothetical protein
LVGESHMEEACKRKEKWRICDLIYCRCSWNNDDAWKVVMFMISCGPRCSQFLCAWWSLMLPD